MMTLFESHLTILMSHHHVPMIGEVRIGWIFLPSDLGGRGCANSDGEVRQSPPLEIVLRPRHLIRINQFAWFANRSIGKRLRDDGR